MLVLLLQPDAVGIGIDWDPKKIAAAQQVTRELPALRFEVADMASWPVPQAGTVFLLDVLHYHEISVQDAILRRAACALTPGGVLFVRDVDQSRGWRALLTRLQERVGRILGLNRGRTLCYRPARDLVTLLEKEGLDVRIDDSFEGTPLANVLIEARRKAVS